MAQELCGVNILLEYHLNTINSIGEPLQCKPIFGWVSWLNGLPLGVQIGVAGLPGKEGIIYFVQDPADYTLVVPDQSGSDTLELVCTQVVKCDANRLEWSRVWLLASTCK